MSRLLLPLVLLLMAPLPATAARLVRITVQLDGKVVLTGHTSDDGYPPAAAVFRYLTRHVLEPETDFKLATEPQNPLAATLKGKLTVEVQYGGKVDVEELRLVCEQPQSARWRVAPDQVETMAAQLGLGPAPPPRPIMLPAAPLVPGGNPDAGWWVLGGAGALVLALLAALAWLRMTAPREAEG